MTGKLMEYFNKQPRLGVISTSSKDGKVDSAVYGSPQMVDDKTVIVALAKGRTFANLQENPNAMFMIMEPAAGILDWKGIRVYLRMKEYVTSGPQIDTYKSQAARIVGKQAVDMIKVLATFEVTEVRPLVDFGQGWEKSI
ncbi:MAG: pyridoxamine 5'-phosphate oxidase family protein [Methanotrichaceae archaeon]|nr:pyridoxamine 5'-phosphate oxidase family protein [Methanotrichaceae archaeon]